MKLNVIERVLLGGIMSTYKGSFINLKLIREGREALSFNEEETKELKFVDVLDGTSWDLDAAIKYQTVDINLGESITSIIKGILQNLNDKEELTEQHFSLYEKFIELE
jgi:hypothetical protein